MLNKDKILSGPYNLKLLGAADAVVFSVSGLKKDSVSFGFERDTYSDELEDGSKDQGNLGGEAVIESTFSEVDPTDMASIEDASIVKAVLEFPRKGKKITIPTYDVITATVDNLKTKITIKKSVGIDQVLTDAFDISVI